MSKNTSDSLTSALGEETTAPMRFRLRNLSPDDGKYYSETLSQYLSAEAEWQACALVQKCLLETRVEFGLAEKKHLNEIEKALEKIDPLNMMLIEKEVTKHDQLAVIEELGRHVSEETKALLHPGTTSYDILDTARSYLFKKCWSEAMLPLISKVILKLCDLADDYELTLQAGRTHLQRTSPVPFGTTLAGYAARLANRLQQADNAFTDLRGKISGIVGTGASIAAVIGEGKSIDFEGKVLKKFNLQADLTATQVVQKERLADVGHALTSLMHVLGDFSNDIRILYSSDINEVTSRDGQKRLGGSSADASKNNPINWENIAGKVSIVESGMRILYELIKTDLQRDLRGSVQGRYQPHQMMAQVYESFQRALRTLGQLSVNEDRLEENLSSVRRFPSEAMVAILRGHGYHHPEFGVGHSAVKEFSKIAKLEGEDLLGVALRDRHFKDFYENSLDPGEQDILNGKLENYLGSALERKKLSSDFAKKTCETLSQKN